MDKVQVTKDELISMLQINRDKHQKNYEDAVGGYRMTAEIELKKRLKKVCAGEKFDLHFSMTEPKTHVKDYNDVIGMLEICTDLEISISMEDYLKFYKDEWIWHHSWSVQNSGYATLYNVAGVGVGNDAKI